MWIQDFFEKTIVKTLESIIQSVSGNKSKPRQREHDLEDDSPPVEDNYQRQLRLFKELISDEPEYNLEQPETTTLTKHDIELPPPTKEFEEQDNTVTDTNEDVQIEDAPLTDFSLTTLQSKAGNKTDNKPSQEGLMESEHKRNINFRKRIRRFNDPNTSLPIDSKQVKEFSRNGTIPADFSTSQLNDLLMASLDDINLIGELLITEETFHSMTTMIRREFIVQGKPKLKKVYPALFITSMVFSARYSDENARNFWEPYAKLVWNIDEADQYLQQQGRQHFKDCRVFLSEYFEHLKFRVESDGDVVRPVFQHAMIPYYLQDDFANWLLQNFKTILDVPPVSLPYVLSNDTKSLQYVAPRLRKFIQDSDTADTAAHLVRQMAEAVMICADGETVEDVLGMMNNPIEQSLWHMIAEQLLDAKELQRVHKAPRPRIEWVWSIDDHSMQIRLTNVASTAKPDLCVWSEANANDLLSASTTETILPWEQSDGSYLLDEVLLQDGPLDGTVFVLSDEYEGSAEDIIFKSNIPNFPTESIVFFRITQQNAYGIPVADNKPNASGEWIVSMADGIAIYDEKGQIIEPRLPYGTPNLLREHANHTYSGQYSLNLPITVKRGNEIILEVNATEDSPVLQSSITGNSPIPSIAPSVPPAFEDTNIYLEVPKYFPRPDKIALSLRSRSDFSEVVRLSELSTEYVDGRTIISLSDILPKESAVYRVTLRENLQPLLQVPLEFSVLEGILVLGPNTDQIYTFANPPVVQFMGIDIDQIVQHEAISMEETSENIVVSWKHFPSNTIHIAISVNNQRIPLAWQIERFYAWTSGNHSNIITDEIVGDTIIHVRGQHNQEFYWIVEGERRKSQLGANGKLDQSLQQDSLYDMIRKSTTSRTIVQIEASEEIWDFFTYIRYPTITSMDISYEVPRQRLLVKVEISSVLAGEYKIQLHKQGSRNLSPTIIDISNSIGVSQVFNVLLEPGDYNVLVLESGQVLEYVASVQTELHVTDQITISQHIDYSHSILNDPYTLLYALKQPAHAFLRSNENLWSPFQCFLDIHNTDTWVETNRYLPAWCVTTDALRASFGNNGFVTLEPEVSSHKGTRGIGHAKLQLEDGPIMAYANWERAETGSLYIHKSHLRLFFPPPEYNDPYFALDDWDLRTVYQCQKCGEIVGSRSGTILKVSPSIWLKHRHGRKQLKAKEIFYDIGNSFDGGYRLLVSIQPDPDHKNGNNGDFLNILSENTFQDTAPLHTSDGHGWARSIADLESIDDWDSSLNALHKWIINSKNMPPMVAATQRMLKRLYQLEDRHSALMLSLALLLRAYPYLSSSLVDKMHSELHLSDDDLTQMVSDMAHNSPELFEWALMWVELFHVHTLN
jgi:hypothetical protein